MFRTLVRTTPRVFSNICSTARQPATDTGRPKPRQIETPKHTPPDRVRATAADIGQARNKPTEPTTPTGQRRQPPPIRDTPKRQTRALSATHLDSHPATACHARPYREVRPPATGQTGRQAETGQKHPRHAEDKKRQKNLKKSKNCAIF